MKKKMLLLLLTVGLTLGGCGQGDGETVSITSPEDAPAYLQTVVQELQSLDEMTPYGPLNTLQDPGLEMLTEWNMGEYADKVISFTIGDTDYSFDLSSVLNASEEWEWIPGGIFQGQSSDEYVALLYDFSPMNHMQDETTWDQQPQILLLSFQSEDPATYEIVPYEIDPPNAFAWMDYCYQLDQKIYFRGEDTLASIDPNTGDLRYYEEETEALQQYASEQYDSSQYHMQFFGAVYADEDVVVYGGGISTATDIPNVGMVFAAYRGEELLGYLNVDYAEDVIEYYQEN